MKCEIKQRPEIALQYSWNCLSPKTKLYTIYGDEVVVYFPGIWNFEEGPDFKDARISINGENIIGDVEVHRSSSDWALHGHHIDQRYDNVILHIVEDYKKNDSLDIPTILFSDEIIKTLPAFMPDNARYPYGYCASGFSRLTDEILSVYFVKNGERRFFEKTSKIIQEILTNGVESAFLQYLFDSCGYKKNRQEFAELFYRISSYRLNALSIEEVVAVLWGESGLLPDPASSGLSPEMQRFVEKNWGIWWKLRKGAKEKISWRLSGVRPLNNPCRRVAAISVLFSRFGIDLFEAMLKEFESIETADTWKIFKKILVCKEELWDCYSNPFNRLNRKAAVMGEMRALDILTNVILPFIYAYSDINSLNDIRDKALAAWKVLPACQQNVILKISSHRWLIPQERAMSVFKMAAAQQGAIFLHKRFCESTQMNCISCPIFRGLQQETNI